MLTHAQERDLLELWADGDYSTVAGWLKEKPHCAVAHFAYLLVQKQGKAANKDIGILIKLLAGGSHEKRT